MRQHIFPNSEDIGLFTFHRSKIVCEYLFSEIKKFVTAIFKKIKIVFHFHYLLNNSLMTQTFSNNLPRSNKRETKISNLMFADWCWLIKSFMNKHCCIFLFSLEKSPKYLEKVLFFLFRLVQSNVTTFLAISLVFFVFVNMFSQ